ncbi:MAG TPA: undecaprenyl-phosphate glucose phosphotransferase [Stellaceae bacterium]|nr:undecaprenyl-phosphate glucose phosphotransferase [Stellaceae bacterium]
MATATNTQRSAAAAAAEAAEAVMVAEALRRATPPDAAATERGAPTAPRPILIPLVRIAMGTANAAAIVLTGTCLALILPQTADSVGNYTAVSVALALIYQVTAAIWGLYDVRAVAQGRLRVLPMTGSWALTALFCLFGLYAIHAAGDISRLWFMNVALITPAFLVGYRLLFWMVARQWRIEGRLARWVALVGGGDYGADLMHSLADESGLDVRVVGYFDDRLDRVPPATAGFELLGTTEQLSEYAANHRLDEIIVSLPWSADARIMEISRKFRHLPIDVRLGPERIAYRLPRGGSSVLELPALVLQRRPLSDWDILIKALEDRALAALLLAGLALPMAAVALLIKLDSRGPVFFRQPRMGFNQKPFHIYKFRTMRNTRSDNALQQAARGDARITRIGRFLRRWSIDEIPQLINVLTGEMSIVGPRPHPMWRTAGDIWPEHGPTPMEHVIDKYAARHRMKPGITGWAQVCGYRGGTEDPRLMRERIAHDLFYIERWSLWLDVKILVLTLRAVLKSENAY